MRSVQERSDERVRVGTLAELDRDGVRVVAAGGRTIAVFSDRGEMHALDNRCPHMGFPLHRGTVRDGILTCHWHHARFDLAGGCTFDPFADDATAFPVEVLDGVVWVDPRPVGRDPRAQRRRKLDEGLEHNLPLVLAKSVIGLAELGAGRDVVERTALFGLRNRAGGWSPGLSILTAMAGIQPWLDERDRPVALLHGAVQVARHTQGQPPSFDLDPLETAETRPERHLQWFRRFVDVRAADAAERTLRTAVRLGMPARAVADMVFAACTDHLFLDDGHTLDFANKAFELLDHLGWERAGEVLPALVPGLAGARRMEETSAWRHPVDLAVLVAEAADDLTVALADDGGRAAPRRWDGHVELAETILHAEPATTLGALRELVRAGVPLVELSSAVAYAAARRPAHFPVTNEFADWNTVHHTFTYANAVDQALRRAPSALLARGILDGAMSVHLERFLNVPERPIPRPSGRPAEPEDLLACFDRHGQVDRAGQIVVDLVAGGRERQAVAALGHALLREDAGFHQFQMYEAGIRQYRRFAGGPAGGHILVGVARFLCAHAPTVRATGQTLDIAARLLRGESLHEDAS